MTGAPSSRPLASLLSASVVAKVQVLSSVSARTVTVFIEASVMNPEKVLGVLSAQAVRPAKASAAIRVFELLIGIESLKVFTL